MSNTDTMFLGNLGSMDIDANFLQATKAMFYGIHFQAFKQVNGSRKEERKYAITAPAHQLIRILTTYAESDQRATLDLATQLNQLEDLITTIHTAQAVAAEEAAAFKELMHKT